MRKIIITGGAGFIGSHLTHLLVKKYPHYTFVVLDDLTYAGNLNYITNALEQKNVRFIKENITHRESIRAIFRQEQPDWIFHLAAESHVDRSIESPQDFVYTNVIGTVNLLDAAREIWLGADMTEKLFFHISTDEVYGSLSLEDKKTRFKETTAYAPHSPYSASKAASDHFVNAYFHTYQIPILISNCSNNYGPHQYPEKLIPVIVKNCLSKKPIPVYGKGENVRDWIFVGDHVSALDTLAHSTLRGQTFNIGSDNEVQNLELVRKICEIFDDITQPKQPSIHLISFVKDRAGHDLRYAIDNSKIYQQTSWRPQINFDEGLRQTVQWYIDQHK